MRYRLLLWAAVGGILLTSLLAWLYLGLLLPVNPRGSEIEFQVEPGESLATVARSLEEAGVLAHRWPLLLWGRVTGADRKIRPGWYRVSAAMSPLSILRKLVAGESETQWVTVPEGLRLERSLEVIAGALELRMAALQQAAYDSSWLASLGVAASSAEGYLFPETYKFPKGADAREVLGTMIRTCLEFLAEDSVAMVGCSLGMNQHEVLTLASIIEAEAALGEERRKISAVYHNRLRLGMPLQADPTVAYALGKRGSALTRADLAFESPYNTYLHRGLPPGPICSPGRASILAAVRPEPGFDALYFVARGDGSHEFSRTHRQHLRALQRLKRRH